MIASLYQSTSRFNGKPLPPGPIAVPPCKAGQHASLYEVTTEEESVATFKPTLRFCGRVRKSFNIGKQVIDSNLALYWNAIRAANQLSPKWQMVCQFNRLFPKLAPVASLLHIYESCAIIAAIGLPLQVSLTEAMEFTTAAFLSVGVRAFLPRGRFSRATKWGKVLYPPAGSQARRSKRTCEWRKTPSPSSTIAPNRHTPSPSKMAPFGPWICGRSRPAPTISV